MNFNALVDYINSTPLTWLILTLGVYKLGTFIYIKSNKNTMLQPIIITYIVLLALLEITNVSYEKYFKSVEIIHFFLGPATVALAVPLYKNLKHIRTLFFPIMLTLFIAGAFSTILALSLLWTLDAQITTILSMATKSITTPIAIITSKQIGAIPSLAVGFVVITGIIGGLFGTIIFKIIGIKHDTSKGFALGLISHGFGTARALEISEKAGAFGALAMGLCGIATSILLPIIVCILK